MMSSKVLVKGNLEKEKNSYDESIQLSFNKFIQDSTN